MINNQRVKGTVSVISSDPSCKDGNVRFTTVTLKPLSDQVEDIVLFLKLEVLNSDYSYKFSCSINALVNFVYTYVEKPQLKIKVSQIINITI